MSLPKRIHASLDLGKIDEANALIEELENWTPNNFQELQDSFKILSGKNLSGPIQVMYNRYITKYESDIDSMVYFIQYCSTRGLNANPIIEKLLGKLPIFGNQRVFSVGECIKKYGNFGLAERIFVELVASTPLDRNARKSLIECLNANGRYRCARKQLGFYIKNIEDTIAEWAFVAEQSSVCGHNKLFQVASRKAESYLCPSDDYWRFIIIKSYSNSAMKKDVARIMKEVSVKDCDSVWLLCGLFRVASQFAIVEECIRISHRIYILKVPQVELTAELRFWVHRLERRLPLPPF